jgi:hypothetical protein
MILQLVESDGSFAQSKLCSRKLEQAPTLQIKIIDRRAKHHLGIS